MPLPTRAAVFLPKVPRRGMLIPSWFRACRPSRGGEGVGGCTCVQYSCRPHLRQRLHRRRRHPPCRRHRNYCHCSLNSSLPGACCGVCRVSSAAVTLPRAAPSASDGMSYVNSNSLAALRLQRPQRHGRGPESIQRGASRLPSGSPHLLTATLARAPVHARRVRTTVRHSL